MYTILNTIKIKRPSGILEKLEFVLASAFYIIGTFAILSEEVTEAGSLYGIEYLFDLLIINAFYFSFLLMNFVVLPRIKEKKAIYINTAIVVVIIIISFLLFSRLDNNMLLLFLSVYFGGKYLILFILSRFISYREAKGNFYTGIFLAGIFYLIFMFLLFAGNADRAAIVGPGILIPCAILLYSYSFLKLIPASLRKRNPFRSYLGKVILILFAAAVPLGLLALILLQDEEAPFLMNVVNVFLQIVITIPLAWFTYKRHIRGKEEVTILKKELGQSAAKFDFLRSQINPHFLFNALNTLYGTAIQENAERTGEGIQQLGDMMRFMLHENMQEKISLSREIEYLRNYINLQKLRTDPNPDLIIQSEIQEQEGYSQISPMLLIPFVENAFKHGISFREPSHIKIALEKKENTVYFDVYNSKHIRPENDPERDKSGIGLTNVKDRLKLLYPEKHELVIRETSKEYFVHLTIDLS